MINMRKLSIYIVVLLFGLLNFISCQKKEKFIDDEFIVVEEDDDSNDLIYTDEIIDEEVDWDYEKKRLKGVGIKDLSIRDYCTISVLIQKDINQYIENNYQDASSDVKESATKNKSEALFQYFGINKEENDEYYNKNKNQIENFIQTHSEYLEILEQIVGEKKNEKDNN